MLTVQGYAPDYEIIVNGTTLRHGANMDIISLSVTDTLSQADTFTFTVRESHPDPTRLFAGGEQLKWMDSDAFREGNEVKISMGYVNNLEFMLLGKIKAFTCDFPESGQPTLRVEGFSLFHDLQHRHLRKPLPDVTDSEIAEELAKRMDLKAEVDPTEVKHALYSPPKGASFATILVERAKRIGYDVSVKGQVLKFQKVGYRRKADLVLTFEWGRNLNSFSPRLSTQNMVTKVTARASQTTLGKGKDALVGTAEAGQERVKMGEKTGNQIAGRFSKDNSILIDDHHIKSRKEAETVALAELEKRALEFIQGTGSVIGNPQLRAGIMIRLEGLGKLFSGNYYVTSATHTIDGGGYRTNFAVKRNAR